MSILEEENNLKTGKFFLITIATLGVYNLLYMYRVSRIIEKHTKTQSVCW